MRGLARAWASGQYPVVMVQGALPSALSDAHLAALRNLVALLPLADVNWALTGSMGHLLQGAPVQPHDIDVQTDEAGVRKAAELLAPYSIAPLHGWESERMRSLFGAFVVDGVAVELLGAVQKRLADGSWGPPTDPAEHRRLVHVESLIVPVLSLEYEAAAYAAIGRLDRASLLRRTLDEAAHGE